MNKEFELPRLTIINFENEDIITDSIGAIGGDDDNPIFIDDDL